MSVTTAPWWWHFGCGRGGGHRRGPPNHRHDDDYDEHDQIRAPAHSLDRSHFSVYDTSVYFFQ